MAKRRSKTAIATGTSVNESAVPIGDAVGEVLGSLPGIEIAPVFEDRKIPENPVAPYSEPRFDPETAGRTLPPLAMPAESLPDNGRPHGEHRSEPASEPGSGEDLREKFSIPQPRGNYAIRVSADSKLRFLRHAGYYQDQIVLEDNQGDRLPLGDRAKNFLKDRGWRDRSVGDEPEMVMTRQLARPTDQDPYARSKSDKQFQDDFVELAQHMRTEHGLPPHEAYEAPHR